MCLAVYIASDQELPLIAWNEQKRAFYVGELSAADDVVRRQFSVPNVRYAGSDAGCGCGFFKDGVVGQELVEAQQNYEQLAAYISERLNSGAQIQLFTCWEGDQQSPKESSDNIEANNLLEKDFEFREKYFYQIKPASSK